MNRSRLGIWSMGVSRMGSRGGVNPYEFACLGSSIVPIESRNWTGAELLLANLAVALGGLETTGPLSSGREHLVATARDATGIAPAESTAGCRRDPRRR